MNECDICKINFSSKQCLTKHLKRKVHLENADIYRCKIENITNYCEICELDFNSTIALTKHLQSKEHIKKENKHNNIKTCDNYCDVCDKYLMHDASIKDHFTSLKHLKKIERNELLDNIENIDEYKIPLYNKKHIITAYTLVDKDAYAAIIQYPAHDDCGYGTISIDGISIKISHYVYYTLNKKEKKDNTIVDHKNRNTFDDRIENLRDISIQMNNRNRSKKSNTTSKYHGVSKTNNK